MPNPLDIKEVKWVDINSIKPWKDNPRKNAEAAKKLAPLLKQHGIKSPIVVWNKDKVVYKGNTTLKAAQILKLKRVPVAFVDFPSLEAAKAYGIADNKSSEFSEWDEEILSGIMGAKGLSVEGTGFNGKEVNNLLMIPNLAKFHKMEESDTGILATIKIVCVPEKKEMIRSYLEATLLRKFSKSVVIK